jgi:hypothetical protein
MSYMLLLFSIKLEKLKKFWPAQISGIDLFGDGWSNIQDFCTIFVICIYKNANFLKLSHECMLYVNIGSNSSQSLSFLSTSVFQLKNFCK